MTKKIKNAIAIACLLGLALLISLYLSERNQNHSLQKKQKELINQLRLKELKTEMSQAKTHQTKVLFEKPGTILASVTGQSSSDPCQTCFKNYSYRISVKDEKGRWIFEDENVFDEKPGKLILTQSFWNEIEKENASAENFQSHPVKLDRIKPERTKNRILTGFEFDRAKIEYAYSPLGIRNNKSELNLILYSSLSMTYSYLPIDVRTGIGIALIV